MYFIKTCPSCSRKIRFPIDKGKIRVTCVCGHGFIADPDDSSLFKNGRFDLKKENSRARNLFDSFSRKVSGLDVANVYPNMIEALYHLKYKLQNFKILPTKEQRKILVVMLVIIIVLVLLIYLALSGPPRQQGPITI